MLIIAITDLIVRVAHDDLYGGVTETTDITLHNSECLRDKYCAAGNECRRCPAGLRVRWHRSNRCQTLGGTLFRCPATG
jgi:hypothetical protein